MWNISGRSLTKPWKQTCNPGQSGCKLSTFHSIQVRNYYNNYKVSDLKTHVNGTGKKVKKYDQLGLRHPTWRVGAGCNIKCKLLRKSTQPLAWVGVAARTRARSLRVQVTDNKNTVSLFSHEMYVLCCSQKGRCCSIKISKLNQFSFVSWQIY